MFVSAVQPGSNAQRRGLGPCLKIMSINGQAVENTDQVRETLSKASSGDVVSFVVATPDQGPDEIV